jgi:hypothetical protein
MERLGVDRTGLFNGLIPVTSLAAVVLVGTGTITPLRSLGAVAVLGTVWATHRPRWDRGPGATHHAHAAARPPAVGRRGPAVTSRVNDLLGW